MSQHPTICPRCGGTDFEGRDVDQERIGPDGESIPIFYTVHICKFCGLYYSGYTGEWLVDCKDWRDEATATSYNDSLRQES
jgi:hypothetical protein